MKNIFMLVISGLLITSCASSPKEDRNPNQVTGDFGKSLEEPMTNEALRNAFSQAQPLTRFEFLKSFEVKNKQGQVERIGGNWNCKDGRSNLIFTPLTADRWHSPKTSAELIIKRDNKIYGVSTTSTKEMAFRTIDKKLLIEFSTGASFKDASVSVENPSRFATTYVECESVPTP